MTPAPYPWSRRPGIGEGLARNEPRAPGCPRALTFPALLGTGAIQVMQYALVALVAVLGAINVVLFVLPMTMRM